MTMGVVRVMFFVAFVLLAFTLGSKLTQHAFERRDLAVTVAPTAGATVVDVARGVEVSMLARLVQIGEDERIVAIDDQPVANDIAAGAAIAQRTLGANTYLDLTVGSARGKRRVLVLMH